MRAGVAVSLLMLACGARAELVVIYDNGHTAPLAPLLEVFRDEAPTAPPAIRAVPDLGAADLARLLPIRTPELTPGPLTPRALVLPNGATIPRPLFLVGADSRSRQWLAQHRTKLLEIGAVGMLVQAESLEEIRAIADLAQGLAILPASASDIARHLQLDRLPVLISSRGIEQ